MERQMQAPNTDSFNRDLLHRAIYDYFRWCSMNNVESNSSNMTSKDTQRITGSHQETCEAASLEQPDLSFLDNPFERHHQQRAHSQEQEQAVTLAAGMEAFHETPMMHQAFAEVYAGRFQRILAVMEQEFPEILQLPAEAVEGKSSTEFERRFIDHPILKQRLQLFMESRTLHQQQQQQPTKQALKGVASSFFDANAAAAQENVSGSTRKRKLSRPGDGDQEHQQQQLSKKLKEQAKEIKNLKSRLQQFRIQATDTKKEKKVQKACDKAADLEATKNRAMPSVVSFEDRLQELVHYAKGHGHTRVPCTSKENPGLARWVQTIRAAYKEKQKKGCEYCGHLTDERMQQLEGIGFEWSIQKVKVSWEERFQELVEFKREHGHCRCVRSYSKNPTLGEWCHRQRFLAHKGQLEQSKVNQLTDLGFEIWIRKQGKSWEEYFEMLLEYRRKHNDLHVPPPDSRTKVKKVIKTADSCSNRTSETAGEAKEGSGNSNSSKSIGTDESDSTKVANSQVRPPGLGVATEEYKVEHAFRRWFVAQRDNYHMKYKKGIQCALNKARVKKLNQIGFDWTREGGDNDLRRLRTGALHHRNDPEIWNQRFQQLLEYKRRFGDSNIPKEWEENKSLGAWVATQRKMYKNLIAGQRSALTHERRLALESIGFQFILRPSRTRAKILEIEGMKPADVAAPSNSNNNTMYHEGHGGGGIVHHTM